MVLGLDFHEIISRLNYSDAMPFPQKSCFDSSMPSVSGMLRDFCFTPSWRVEHCASWGTKPAYSSLHDGYYPCYLRKERGEYFLSKWALFRQEVLSFRLFRWVGRCENKAWATYVMSLSSPSLPSLFCHSKGLIYSLLSRVERLTWENRAEVPNTWKGDVEYVERGGSY